MSQRLARMLTWKPQKSLCHMATKLVFCERRQIVGVVHQLNGHYLLVLCGAECQSSLDDETCIAVLCIAEQVAPECNSNLASLLLCAVLKNGLDYMMAKIVAAELHHLSQHLID